MYKRFSEHFFLARKEAANWYIHRRNYFLFFPECRNYQNIDTLFTAQSTTAVVSLSLCFFFALEARAISARHPAASARPRPKPRTILKVMVTGSTCATAGGGDGCRRCDDAMVDKKLRQCCCCDSRHNENRNSVAYAMNAPAEEELTTLLTVVRTCCCTQQ